jgi:hypothetical protein
VISKERADWYRDEARRIYGEYPNIVEEKAEVHEVHSGGAYVTCLVWIDEPEER